MKTRLVGHDLTELEGSFHKLGDEPLEFEKEERRLGPNGKTERVPAGAGGSEGYVAWVRFRGQRWALKLLKQQSPVRQKRMAFLSELRLYDLLPVFAAAPFAAVSGIVQPKGKPTQIAINGHLSRFVYGRTLAALMSSTATQPSWAEFPLESRVRMAAELAGAVTVLERVGLAHGDLKPQNLIVEEEPGQTPGLRLVDYDSFHFRDPIWAPPIPRKEIRVKGSRGYVHANYAAPEPDLVTSDRLALAVLCYELVALEPSHIEWREKQYTLFQQDELSNRKLDTPPEIRELWPEGWGLLEQAILADTAEAGPGPDTWLSALERRIIPTADSHPLPAEVQPYQLILEIRNQRHPAKVTDPFLPICRPTDSLVRVSPDLSWLRYVWKNSMLRLLGTAPPERANLFRYRNRRHERALGKIDFDAQIGDVFLWSDYEIKVASSNGARAVSPPLA
jgi:hypothetical protein